MREPEYNYIREFGLRWLQKVGVELNQEQEDFLSKMEKERKDEIKKRQGKENK